MYDYEALHSVHTLFHYHAAQLPKETSFGVWLRWVRVEGRGLKLS
jgi:hypothetical protein